VARGAPALGASRTVRRCRDLRVVSPVSAVAERNAGHPQRAAPGFLVVPGSTDRAVSVDPSICSNPHAIPPHPNGGTHHPRHRPVRNPPVRVGPIPTARREPTDFRKILLARLRRPGVTVKDQPNASTPAASPGCPCSVAGPVESGSWSRPAGAPSGGPCGLGRGPVALALRPPAVPSLRWLESISSIDDPFSGPSSLTDFMAFLR
jgi:hypothetical protein